MKKYTRKKGGGNKSIVPKAIRRFTIRKKPTVSSVAMPPKQMPPKQMPPMNPDDRDLFLEYAPDPQATTDTDMSNSSGDLLITEEKKQDLRKKYLLGCARLKEKKVQDINKMKFGSSIVMSILNSFEAFTMIKSPDEIKKKDYTEVEQVISKLYNTVKEKNPMILIVPRPLRKYQISSTGYIPDLIKHFTTYWILEFLLDEPSDIETFKKYCNWASETDQEIEELKEKIIKKYIKVYSNLSDDEKQVPEDISEKRWEEWPLKEPWVDFLETKRTKQITYKDFYYDNALKKQKGGRKRRYKTKRRFYKKKREDIKHVEKDNKKLILYNNIKSM